MERKRSPVKPRRPYNSTRRQDQARQTRQAILDTARRLFLSDGFAPTTIAAIAAGVGVSVDTVYKTFGGKAGLVRAICEQALAGEGPVPAETRSDALHAAARDPRQIIRGWGALMTEVAPRVAPILLLVRAAAADPDMAGVQREMDAQRIERMTHNASNLAAAGHLRHDMSVELAGEIMWTYSSPELYELLVLNRGWTVERYAAFVADAMIAALLPPEPATSPPADQP
jgi:AcrR family transcriptional regulator